MKNKVNFPVMTGRMKELYDYILATSPIERPILTNASVLAIFATMYSNLYRFNNSYPVLYLMMVGRSGSGKNRPLKAAKSIFSSCDLFDYIGQAGYRSDAAIIDQLVSQRHRLDMLDEVDAVLKLSKSDNGFVSGIINILTELWSDCSAYYPGRRTRTDGLYGNCWNPCVNIISALTPTAFRENFSKSMMMTGFGGRFLYFIADENSKLKKDFIGKTSTPVPNEIIKHFRACEEMKQGGLDSEKDRYNSLNLSVSKDARERLEEIRTILFHQGQKLKESNPMSPVVQRMYENIERLLIIHTVSNNYEDTLPIIQIENVEWCYQFMLALYSNSESFLEDNVLDGTFELLKGKILRPIKEAGKVGINHSKLLKNSHMAAEQLRKIVTTLEECNLITQNKIKGSTVYFYIGLE